ncbi:hypothetical protein D3C87_351650 [compost metagenome]
MRTYPIFKLLILAVVVNFLMPYIGKGAKVLSHAEYLTYTYRSVMEFVYDFSKMDGGWPGLIIAFAIFLCYVFTGRVQSDIA